MFERGIRNDYASCWASAKNTIRNENKTFHAKILIPILIIHTHSLLQYIEHIIYFTSSFLIEHLTSVFIIHFQTSIQTVLLSSAYTFKVWINTSEKKCFPIIQTRKACFVCFFFSVKHDNIDDDVVVVSATVNMNAQNKKN